LEQLLTRGSAQPELGSLSASQLRYVLLKTVHPLPRGKTRKQFEGRSRLLRVIWLHWY